MSKLRPLGSTRGWRELRKWWAAQLPLPCPRCGALVQPWDRWDLDHQVPRAIGGTDDTARPAHERCNRAANSRAFDSREKNSRARSRDREDGPVFSSDGGAID